MPPLSETKATLEWVTEYWPDLLEARFPGTPRPRPHHEDTAETRRARDEQAAAERAERGGNAIGDAPAPIDLDIAQTVYDLLAWAEDLAAVIAETADAPAPPPPGPGNLDARPYLRHAIAHLEAAAARAPHIAEWAASVADRMCRRAAGMLGMIYDGQLLSIICPWCGGKTPHTPSGGAYTWRVRVLPGDLIAVVCEGICEPPEACVTTWWYGHPVWPLHRWPWLAEQARHGAPPEAA